MLSLFSESGWLCGDDSLSSLTTIVGDIQSAFGPLFRLRMPLFLREDYPRGTLETLRCSLTKLCTLHTAGRLLNVHVSAEDARSTVRPLFQVSEKNKCKARPAKRLHIVLQSLPVIFIAITVAKSWRKARRCADSKSTPNRDTHAYHETGVERIPCTKVLPTTASRQNRSRAKVLGERSVIASTSASASFRDKQTSRSTTGCIFGESPSLPY